MALIKAKVKIKLISEEDLEWDEESMGKVYKDPQWVWKYKVIDVCNIYELTEFTQNKTIMEMNDGRLLLVAESMDTLHQHWNEAREKDLDLGEELPEEELSEGEEED